MMRCLKAIVFLLYLTTSAQEEASRWFFGENAGLNFSTGIPIVDLNGALSTDEGCATISDKSGNLLFLY